MLTRVFDLFTQENRTLDRSQGGPRYRADARSESGRVARGTVRVSSEGPSRGSEFIVRLPALPAGVRVADKPETSHAHVPPPQRFLIVDDNIDSAESLAELLNIVGHEARTAHDGAAALVEAETHRPDVILLDIGLPHMDGYEVARRVRRNPNLRNVTLIAMTGYGQDEDRRRSQDAGFDHHLVKPVDVKEIHQLLTSRPSVRE